jgi:heme A synthase
MTSRGVLRLPPVSMLAMRATTPRPDARPRHWRWLVLALVTLVATALALGLALHHDDGAPAAGPGIEQSAAEPSLAADLVVESAGAMSAPGTVGALVCSLLILCCVTIALSKLRARSGSLKVSEPRPSSDAFRSTDVPPRTAFLVSLTALSISRT